jgi:hypothetical protein
MIGRVARQDDLGPWGRRPVRERRSVGAGDMLEEVGYDGGGEGAGVFLLDVRPAVGGGRVRASARVYRFWRGTEEALRETECHVGCCTHE